ncbi:MAG TPA: tetratricopeptide repeat protein [Gemmatimonadales bacterium]|nr:tetratricopeptide repeat protein [Gemmatimonadales bacterium]
MPTTSSKIKDAIEALVDGAQTPERRDPELAKAKRLLTSAILGDQGSSPAAWYYLGRQAVLAGDATGADTAFARARTLEPKCAADIAIYRGELWGELLNNRLAAWQDGKRDSGLALLHRAARFDPANPKPYSAVAALFSSTGNDDSALAYYRLAAQTAGTDTTYTRDKRDALSNAWHLVVRKVQGHPAVQGASHLRAGLDSLARGITADSTVLARLVSSSQSRQARHAHLAPADQQAFTRDSTARAQNVARQRAAVTASLQQIAADSSALGTAFAPAIEALGAYLAAFPDDPEAAVALATLYAQSGRTALAAAVFDSLAAHAPALDPEALFGPGAHLVGQGLYRPGARALTVALAKNPYRRDALLSLGVAYYQLRDSAALLPVAQRLLDLDPLNRASLRLVAAGWDLRRARDSSRAYVARADSGVAVEITVSTFTPDSATAAFFALANNVKAAPSKPFHLTVEFLDFAGQPVASVSHDVPALAPRQSHPFELQASAKRVAGWRYRPS